MSQHNNAVSDTIRYTRADNIALRAYLSKVDLPVILNLYYYDDDLDERKIEGSRGLGVFLDHMRDYLIERLSDANPHMAEALMRARQSASWSKAAIAYLIEAADKEISSPRLRDPVTQWFKPVAAKRLKEDGINTLEDLMVTIRARGRGWYRPIPCLGKGKASAIVNWLGRYAEALGPLPRSLSDPEHEIREGTVVVARFSKVLVPFERIRLASDLNGSNGINRHHIFPLIPARNDYEAVEAYLIKHQGEPKTQRSYRKELERFLLWCVAERGVALSSALAEDCEAYKAFIANPDERWVGTRKPRKSVDWRPFAGTPSAESQRYAVLVIRTFFTYLVGVRYLTANPWIAVSMPKVVDEIHAMQIEKALTSTLWDKLSAEGGILDQLCAIPEEELIKRYRFRGFAKLQPIAAQVRLCRALILILGFTGVRREELSLAIRRELKPFDGAAGVWQLRVLGKGKRRRYTYLTDREIEAIKAHWQDRGEDFSFAMTDLPLVSPVIIPPTGLAKKKHFDSEKSGARGCSPDGIYTAVTTWLTRIANDELFPLTEEERDKLKQTGIHAFRHTFGTNAVGDDMPLNVVQALLGHKSLNTTSIYVKSAEQRKAEEVGKWAKKRRENPGFSH